MRKSYLLLLNFNVRIVIYREEKKEKSCKTMKLWMNVDKYFCYDLKTLYKVIFWSRKQQKEKEK